MNEPRILVAHNAPVREQKGRKIDFVSEAGVLDQVRFVEEALLSLNYDVKVEAAGRSIHSFLNRLTRSRPAAIFNLVEGWKGESRFHQHFPCVYELLGLEYTGSPTSSLFLTTDKWRTKLLLGQAGLPVPKGILCTSVPVACDLAYPLIVKPVREDASLGIDFASVVRNLADLQGRIDWVLRHYQQPALVEEYIEGRELNVSVIGDRSPEVLPISEVTFRGLVQGQPRICSYNVKWMETSREFAAVEAVCPALLEEETEALLKQFALSAFQLAGCRDYARVDFRLSVDNRPYILEVNANPDISPDAGLMRSARASGRSGVDLVADITSCALFRRDGNEGPRPASQRSTVGRKDLGGDRLLH